MSPFHPVVKLPEQYEISDFTKGYDAARLRGRYVIGRYDENRIGMYNSELFKGPDLLSARTVHVGVDIGAPVGTEVYAFDDGEIFLAGINSAQGDYGGTLITKHLFQERALYALHGHLAHRSLVGRVPGQNIKKGDVIGWIGDEKENGGWNPHVHFQLSWLKPTRCDLPGVVSLNDRAQALIDYPDPRLVLGRIY